jgi:predicted enzyme related to lactoylglutathione lyase
MNKPKFGTIEWIDLSVPNAIELRDFYSQVTGWTSSPVTVADYEDYCVHPAGTEQPVAGICHARGENANMPAQWLIYINVEDIDNSIRKCLALGGSIVVPMRDMGSHGRMCVIKDPAGAVSALIEPRAD